MPTRDRLPLAFLVLYGLGALAMGLGDIAYPPGVGTASSWGVAPGWIHEIGCFDLCLAAMCALCVLEIRQEPVVRLGIRTVMAGSVFIGLNNLYAYVESGKAGHLQAVVTHSVVLIVGALSLRALRAQD